MQILLAALISCQYGSDFKWKEKLDNKLESEILDFETFIEDRSHLFEQVRNIKGLNTSCCC